MGISPIRLCRRAGLARWLSPPLTGGEVVGASPEE